MRFFENQWNQVVFFLTVVTPLGLFLCFKFLDWCFPDFGKPKPPEVKRKKP